MVRILLSPYVDASQPQSEHNCEPECAAHQFYKHHLPTFLGQLLCQSFYVIAEERASLDARHRCVVVGLRTKSLFGETLKSVLICGRMPSMSVLLSILKKSACLCNICF